MSGHNARVIDSLSGIRWGWDCAKCGDWSNGYNYRSREAAERAARRHNEVETEADERAAQRLYGPKQKDA
jgi:ribosomal protein L37AE/L43A